MLRIFILRNDQHAQSLWAFLKGNWKATADAGRPLAVNVSQHKDKRTLAQNARYWGVVLPAIVAQAWIDGRQFSSNAWHEHFKRTFIGLEDAPGGATAGLSSAELDVEAFCDFMTKVEAYAASDLSVEFN